MAPTAEPAVHLLRGEDAALLSAAVTELVHRLVGAGDRSLMVDEFDGDDDIVPAVVDAAQTPPFLTDRRIVVARDLSRFPADALAPLVRYLADPLPTTSLVVTWSSGRIPKSLADAVKSCGGAMVDTDPPATAKARQDWLDEHFAAADVKLDASARSLVAATLGEDVARLDALLRMLESTFGAGARLRADDVEPFLGTAGSVPPWELTDAIDRGDTALALERLRRMVRAGERHPLQVMAVLHGHYSRMLRLDGSGVSDERGAADVLGMKGSTFPARKALDAGRRLGSDGIRRAFALLAGADLDLRGRVEWPEELVMEVLVARLSRLAPRSAAGVSRRAR